MKKTPNRVLIINVISAGLLNGISMIMMPIYSRLLGTEVYGLSSVYTTWVTILSIIVGLQVSTSIGIAQRDFPVNKQLAFQANGVYIGLVMCVVITGLVVLFSTPLSNLLEIPLWAVMLLVPHAFGIFCIGVLNAKFTYEFKQEKNLLVSVCMSLGTALISVVTILLLPTENRFAGRVIGVAVPYILCAALLVFYLVKKVGLCVQKEYIGYMLHYSIPLMISNLCLQFFESSDKLMLQKMESNSAVGIYSLAFSFSAVISSIWYALNHAWTPFYYQYESVGDKKDLLLHAKRYTRLFSILTIGFVLLSPEVFSLLSAPEFHAGVQLIPVFVIGFYLNFIRCFARNYQYYYKQTKIIAVISVAASLCNLGLNIVLIPVWGSLGAAVATMITQGISFGVQWMVARYHSFLCPKYPYRLKLFMPYVVLLGISIVLFYLPGTGWLRWTSGGIMGIWLLAKFVQDKQLF